MTKRRFRRQQKPRLGRRGSELSESGGESWWLLENSSRRDARFVVRRLAQHVAAAPDRLDVVLAVGRVGELLAQLADEDVDDLELGLVHPAIEMVEEHLFGQRRALAQAEEFENAVFLAGQMQRMALDLDRAAVEVDGQLTRADD